MIVEIFTFRLAPGMSEADFLKADARVQNDFYYRRPGIVRRTTARAGDDWCVVVFWQRMDDALAAAEAVNDTEFASCIEGVAVQRFETLD